MLAAIAGARIILAGNPVVVPIQPVWVVPRPAVLEEENLSSSLAVEIGAILVAGRGRRCPGEQEDEERGRRSEEKRQAGG
jgi:hypothetical protein